MDYRYKLTILTPAYNRANCLPKLYHSLCQQTNKDFQWLVIDDGSTDNTSEVLEGFSADGFAYEHYNKPNGGKHTALNYAHPHIKGEWTCIVDSDDWLIPSAVQDILNEVGAAVPLRNVKILTFLRGRGKASPLNADFPESPTVSNHIDFRINARRSGDCCEVIYTDVLKERPFPEYQGERFLGEGYLWNYTGFHYDTLYINKVIYICEYLDGGLTKSGRKMRIKCPLGGMENSNSFFEGGNGRKVKTKILHKEAILFVCYGKFANLEFLEIVKRCHNKTFAIMDYLLGVALYYYWKNKYLK